MKKLLAIFMMILFVGCATTVPEKHKVMPTVPTVPTVPTQEQILQDEKIEYQLGLFTDWWTKESLLFQGYLSSLANMPIKIITVTIEPMDDFNMVVVQIVMISSMGLDKAFVIVTRDSNEWKINAIVELKEPETQNEGVEVSNNHDYKL